MNIDRTGEVHHTREGDKFTIIKYINNRNSSIQFEDGVILYNRDYKSLRLGHVKHLNRRNIYNIGYIGYGEYNYTNSKKAYKTWHSMLQRCYEQNTKNNLSYKDRIHVCEQWECFQNFVPWFIQNYNPETMKGWELDKDLLCATCNLYSPETCLFLPREINCRLFKTKEIIGQKVGARKTKFSRYAVPTPDGYPTRTKNFADINEAHNFWVEGKKLKFKNLANKYKECLDDRAYGALLNINLENFIKKESPPTN